MSLNKAKHNIHKGHRDRMLTKYQENGPGIFEDHELLEMLLYFGIAQKNTNDIAHRLIDDKGNLYHVMSSDLYKLTETDGVGTKMATLIKLAHDVTRRGEQKEYLQTPLNSHWRRSRYIMDWYQGKPKNTVMAIFTDKDQMLIETKVFSSGSKLDAHEYERLIPEAAKRCGAKYAILCHNHSNNCPDPSVNDLTLTGKIRAALFQHGTYLLDHYIVTETDCQTTLESKDIKEDEEIQL